MDLDDLMAELEHLTSEQFAYLGLAAAFGPFVLKLFGFKVLARLIRPVALGLFVGGLFAKQGQAE